MATNWDKANPEKMREYKRQWKIRNKEKYAKYVAEYDRKTQATRNAREALRRAKQMEQTPEDADLNIIESIYKMAKRRTKVEGRPYEVDHIIPLAKGGLHHQDNLQILTAHENRVKHARILGEVV